MKDYNKCKEKFVDKILIEYENDELKDSGKKIVKEKKQALAIALTTAQDNCEYSKSDYVALEEKVKEFLYNDDRKISKTRVPLTNVIETKELYLYYLNINKRKANKFRDDLIKRISDSGKKGIKISKNIFKEIYSMY